MSNIHVSAGEANKISAECADVANSPGAYEGEARYVPHMDSAPGSVMWSFTGHRVGIIRAVEVNPTDRYIFSELEDRDVVILYENNHGFVSELDEGDVEDIVPDEEHDCIDWEPVKQARSDDEEPQD